MEIRHIEWRCFRGLRHAHWHRRFAEVLFHSNAHAVAVGTEPEGREDYLSRLGDAGSSLSWHLCGSHLLSLYTAVFGLPAAAAGTMFLVLYDLLCRHYEGVIARDRRRG